MRSQIRKQYDVPTRVSLLEDDMDNTASEIRGLREDLSEYADRQESKFDSMSNKLIGLLSGIAIVSVGTALTVILAT